METFMLNPTSIVPSKLRYLPSLTSRSVRRSFSACSRWGTDGVYREPTATRTRTPFIEAFKQQQNEAHKSKAASSENIERDISPKTMADSYTTILSTIYPLAEMGLRPLTFLLFSRTANLTMRATNGRAREILRAGYLNFEPEPPSQAVHNGLPQTFEYTEAIEKPSDDSLPQTGEGATAVEEPAPVLYNTSTGNTSASAGPLQTLQDSASTSIVPTVSNPKSSQPSDTPAGGNRAAAQHTCSQADTKGPGKTRKARKATKARKSTSVPLSIKQDLTAAEISSVTHSLIRSDASSFSQNNLLKDCGDASYEASNPMVRLLAPSESRVPAPGSRLHVE
ncbi:hypothetical protein BKA64DRAFT_648654 [Cadophora sp. MPI-SDFR-AT-0126]|nr:hypothetical protein BKA64DRAFT_648654 [Leotiomycetes sp. MPI-SDFR-AT-0126]